MMGIKKQLGVTLVEVLLYVVILSAVLIGFFSLIRVYQQSSAFNSDLMSDVRNVNAVINAADHYFNSCNPVASVKMQKLIDKNWGDIEFNSKKKYFYHLDIFDKPGIIKVPISKISFNIVLSVSLTSLSASQSTQYEHALGIVNGQITRHLNYPTYQSNDFGLGNQLSHYIPPPVLPPGVQDRC